MVDDFRPGIIVDSAVKDRSPTRKKLHEALALRRRGVAITWRGDGFVISDHLKVRVLYPPAGLKRNAADDKAFVLLLEGAGVRTLLMSDSGFATEQWLAENEPDLKADILVKGQHAKDLSGTLDFVTRVGSKIVVTSAANLGAAPQRLAVWEEDIRAHGIEVFRQDECGAVVIAVRGDGFEARSFLGDQTFRSRAR